MRIFWKSKGISPKKILGVCLAFVMTLSLLSYALAITDGADDNSPYLTVTAVGVNNAYVEIGLNIKSQDNGFYSAGAVVKYDPALLTPINWAQEPAVVNVAELPADADTYTEKEARDDWNNADAVVALDTKGPDELSGKKALAFNKEIDSTLSEGYLYLMAESPLLRSNWDQTLPELSDKAGDTANGVPYYTPLGNAKVETPIEQSVVVRLMLMGNDISAALASIDIAKGAVSLGAPINDESGVAYFNNDRGNNLPVNVQILLAEQGTTYSTGGTGGGASTEGIVAVTAFDWDGAMMGTFIFATDDDTTKQQANADAAIAEFKARPSVDAMLKSHAGYDFLDFVKNEDGIPTSYGKRVETNDNTKLADDLELNPADKVDFADLSESTTVKAAYTTNSECITGEDQSNVSDAVDARRYTTSIDSYGRFGTGNSFALRIKVERKGVLRVTDGALRVRLQIDGVSVYSQYALAGSDVEIVEVAPYAGSEGTGANAKFKGVELVEWTVIDRYGSTDWVGAQPRTTLNECQKEATFTIKNVGRTRNVAVWDEETYPFYGVIAGINDALASYHKLKLADVSGTLAPDNDNMGGVSLQIMNSINIPSLALLTARTNLYNAYVANGAKPLDYAAIYEAASGTPLS